MKTKNKAGKKDHKHLVHDAEGAATGAVAGAILGAVAGPPGIIAGAIMGAAAGAVAAEALETEGERVAAHTRKVGAYSTAATGTGASGGGSEPAEGPMQIPKD